MPSLIKTLVLSSLILPLTLTSCGEEKESAAQGSSENSEKQTPLSIEDAVTKAFGAITAARAYDVDWDTYPEVIKHETESYRLEKEYRAAIKAHPDLVELRKLQDEPGIETVERFRRVGAVSIAANQIPAIAKIKKQWDQSQFSRIKAMIKGFEKEGKIDLAKTIKALVGRVQ